MTQIILIFMRAYQKLNQDVAHRSLPTKGKFDLIFSLWLWLEFTGPSVIYNLIFSPGCLYSQLSVFFLASSHILQVLLNLFHKPICSFTSKTPISPG